MHTHVNKFTYINSLNHYAILHLTWTQIALTPTPKSTVSLIRKMLLYFKSKHFLQQNFQVCKNMLTKFSMTDFLKQNFKIIPNSTNRYILTFPIPPHKLPITQWHSLKKVGQTWKRLSNAKMSGFPQIVL